MGCDVIGLLKDIVDHSWLVLRRLNKIFFFYMVLSGDAEYDIQKTGTCISQRSSCSEVLSNHHLNENMY